MAAENEMIRRQRALADFGDFVLDHEDLDAVLNESCRLIARSRAERRGGGVLYVLAIELPHAIMERRMLLGTKQRAERASTGGS